MMDTTATGGAAERVQLTHRGEQSRAALTEVAALLGAYYEQLCDRGFNEAQAFVLVQQIQAFLIQQRREG